MELHDVSQGIQKRRHKKRVGRGIGSGHGKTSTRGMKGQYSSAGAGLPGPLFTGGQTPIHRTYPKRGFSNARFQKDYCQLNVYDLDGFPEGATVDLAAIKAARVRSGAFEGLRILGEGELTKKLTVRADHFTKTAREKIEAKGGTCDLIPPPTKPVRNKMGQGKWSAKKKDKPADAAG